jgi:hypothetical protein
MWRGLGWIALGLALAPTAWSREVEPLLSQDVFAPPDRRLDLVYVDVQRVVPFAFARLGGEVAAIFGREDVSVRWRIGGGDVLAEEREVTVILLNGTGDGNGVVRQALGATQPAGAHRNQVWVYVPTVAWSLGLDLADRAAWGAGDRVRFSVALGRVVAHELFHVLAPELPHSRRGLMAARIGRHELLDTSVEVAEAFREALRPSLLRRAQAALASPAQTRN